MASCQHSAMIAAVDGRVFFADRAAPNEARMQALLGTLERIANELQCKTSEAPAAVDKEVHGLLKVISKRRRAGP